MRDILFALWGATIASAWWALGMYGLPIIIMPAVLFSLGMAWYIIIKGLEL